MADIKLFVCCHQQVEIPNHPLLVPIQVGAALAETHFPNFLYDDAGENISEKNRSYCELTAQYWAWKNVGADYFGFFHYRRYLYPEIECKRPYRIERRADLALLDKLGYDGFPETICQYDLIAPMGEEMYIPVREHYANAPHHHQRDMELMERIVWERCPEMAEAMKENLSGTVCSLAIFISCVARCSTAIVPGCFLCWGSLTSGRILVVIQSRNSGWTVIWLNGYSGFI